MSESLTHLDAQGRARMVDVGDKPVTTREATARAFVYMSAKTLELLSQGKIGKGEVFQVARLAGVMAAKRTDELIPLCHSLGLDVVEVRLALLPEHGALVIEATARVQSRTGVEMEAMMAVSVAALTVYDMCKGVDRAMRIDHTHVWRKRGGRSGEFVHPEPPGPALGDELLWA